MRLVTTAILAMFALAACKDDSSSDDSAAPQDADGDGALSTVDCDDDNPSVFPGNPELCDGLDNDCNGYADDEAGDATVWYVDYDADGYGAQSLTYTACESPSGFASASGDCDDTNPQAYPDATELCDDGADNNCEGLIDCDDGACGGDAFCAPTVASVTPSQGKEDETTSVVISGTGFDFATSGTVTVTVGSTAALNVTVVDGETLTADIPPGAHGTVDLVVSTDNGDGTLSSGWRWTAGVIYAADGTGGTVGNLYEVDLESGAVSTVGAIGYAVTGMAFSPDGTLYAVQAGYGYDANLLTINTETGAGTVVGPLSDSSGSFNHGHCPDITFVGDRLLGWTENSDDLVEIDPSTGVVTVFSESGLGSAGSGLAYDSSAMKLYFQVYGSFYSVDPSSGAGTYLGSLTGQSYYGANAMTMFEGSLYGTDHINGSGANNLVRIDPVNLTVTFVATLPNTVDAIAAQ